MSRPFSMIDVFADSAFTGNPVAVITGADGLDTAEMQRITQWLNLSETTFLLPPEHRQADYKVRIFTLERELPFAGHPTLGTCHAWLTAGGQPRGDYIVQECGAGLVQIKRDGKRLALAAPPPLRSGPLEDGKIVEICEILGISRSAIVDHQWLDNGPGWAGVLLESAAAVRTIKPQRSLGARIEAGTMGPHGPASHIEIGIIGPGDNGADWELRALFTDASGTLIEDPVTGSLNASAAQWLLASGRAKAPYRAVQGTCLGRDGRIYVDQDTDDTIWIGGQCITLFSGQTGF
ncbi:MAG: PhzF family phenazine biosynthesis protein [Alphaproteobacteria bacterium]|nr:PhzF family phenazine biosynthesis protein [Alphaproteobacteria bacterium]MDE2042391.1 PhzF family phenazine biosynthesis protein [Alphaproteobacteria bacterium]MDE2340297.1 PhzF family phenazine biosynthesis protein [Alphaproteobacteria bacterium]